MIRYTKVLPLDWKWFVEPGVDVLRSTEPYEWFCANKIIKFFPEAANAKAIQLKISNRPSANAVFVKLLKWTEGEDAKALVDGQPVTIAGESVRALGFEPGDSAHVSCYYWGE